jgi:hypothetical protein
MKNRQPIVSVEQYVVPPDGGLITRFPSNQAFRKNYSGLFVASNVRAAAGRLNNAAGFAPATFSPPLASPPILITDVELQDGAPLHVVGDCDSLYAVTQGIPIYVSAGNGGVTAGLGFTFADASAIYSLGGTLSVEWSMVSGPGTTAFADAGNINTGVVVSTPGLYYFKVTGTDGVTTVASSPVSVRFIIVTAGPTPYTFPGSAAGALNLVGTVAGESDPTNPESDGMSYVWQFVSGPGVVTFDDAGSLTPVATFAANAGTGAQDYVLQLLLTVGATSYSSQVSVTVPAPSSSSPALNFCGVQNNWPTAGNLPYANSGNNTTGFVQGGSFTSPDARLSSDGTTINNSDLAANGWMATPAIASGDFQVQFDVYEYGPYIDGYVFFVDSAFERGFGARFSAQDTDTPSCELNLCCRWNQAGSYPAYDGSGFFGPIREVDATTEDLPLNTWVTVIFKRIAGVFYLQVGTQNVGSFDSQAAGLCGYIGLGYYTGGVGGIKFRNLSVVNI